MTGKMKTVCVGRYLVDVPRQAELSLSGRMIAGFTIDSVEEIDAMFRERVIAREADILVDGKDAGNTQPGGLIESRDLRIPGMIGCMPIFGRDRTYGFERGRRVDMEWVLVEVHAHSREMSFTLSKKYASEGDARLAETLLARLQVRGENEVPSVPGFCVWRGVFAEPLPEHTDEHVIFHLGLPGHPDMGSALASTPGGPAERGLLDRVAGTDAQASVDEMLRVTKLRSGKRRIHDIDGEELPERVRELNFSTGYNFIREAPGVENDNLRPFLSLTMETGTNLRPGGKPVDSSLRQDAFLALWDRISSSIRSQASARPEVCTSAPTLVAHDAGPARR